jgi:glutaredoxin
MNMLILYVKQGCSFCTKVLDFAARQSIELNLKDIYSDQEIMDELIARGGKRQVPYLVDEDKDIEMYESADIVEYLKTNYVH